MAQNMGRTSAWTRDTSTPHRLSNNYRDCAVGSESTKGSAGADKRGIRVGLRPGISEVRGNRITNLLGQRQPRLASSLSRNRNPGLLPVQIAHAKLDDIPGPK